MKNINNKLGLKTRSNLRVLNLAEGITVAIPTVAAMANAKVVSVKADGSFTAHYSGNFNLVGDFSSELMKFDADLVLDTGDKDARNARRIANGLMPIK